MMKLLQFQRESVDAVVDYYDELVGARTRKATGSGKKAVDPAALAWVMSGQSTKSYCSFSTDSGSSIPNIALCVPTGGGKTIIGVSAAVELLLKKSSDELKFVVWMVPTDAIYQQIYKDLSLGGKYHSFVKERYAKDVNIKTSTDSWIDDDLKSGHCTILLLSFQSIIRKRGSKNLLIYRNADKVAALSVFNSSALEPSLYSLIKIVKPFFIIDESHRYYTEIGRDFFKHDEIAELIIEMSATHRQYSQLDYPNVIYSVSGKTLIDEELIKRPIVYHSLQSFALEELLSKVVSHQNVLEARVRTSQEKISPKVLISSEYTGVAHSENEYSAQNIKILLTRLGVNSDAIAIKSSEVDQISGFDLDDPQVPLRYIITKRALMEGWDCKSVYTIVLINNIGADTTNFQLIGRGLRQPNKKYFPYNELNELHLFTNSSSHDDSVRKLTSFLSDIGLSDADPNFVVSFDNRVLQRFVLAKDFQFTAAVSSSSIDADQAVALLKILEDESILQRIIVKESELPASEEIMQKIDISRSRPVGILQGRPSYISMFGDIFDWKGKLQSFIFQKLSTIIPSAGLAFKISQDQVSILSDFKSAYLSRTELFLLMRDRVSSIIAEHFESYFSAVIFPTISFKSCHLSEVCGAIIEINATPDLNLDKPFSSCIYGNLPKSIFNSDELVFSRFLDELPNTVWMRNFPKSGVGFPYSGGNFYPDFILFHKDPTPGTLKTCYIETKGSHLSGNDDTTAKLSAIEKYNALNNDFRIFLGDFQKAKEIALKFSQGILN